MKILGLKVMILTGVRPVIIFAQARRSAKFEIFPSFFPLYIFVYISYVTTTLNHQKFTYMGIF